MNTAIYTDKDQSATSLARRIAEHAFFKGLSQQYLDLVADVAVFKEFKADEVIFREGDPANRFYLIESGRVAMEAVEPKGGKLLLQTLGPGKPLGWSWLFPPFLCRFEARALECTRAITFNGGQLLVACEENHHFGYEMMKRVALIVIARLQSTRGGLLRFISKPPALPAPSSLSQSDTSISLEAAVAEHPFLSGLTPAQLKILTAHAMKMRFDPGQVIFKTGDPANRFYLIRQGRVALEARSPKGPAVVQVLGDGDVLGWPWLYEPYSWHFDARALQPTSAIFFYGTGLRESCEQDHDLGYELLKRMTQVVIDRLQATRKEFLLAFES